MTGPLSHDQRRAIVLGAILRGWRQADGVETFPPDMEQEDLVDLERLLRRHVIGPVAGICRICGCTQADACVIAEGLTLACVTVCSWVDDTHTLCSNPQCLEEAKKEA